ncbi:MAG TPA: DUF559 domain-containing protein [Thermoleophilaceae bacterium]
MPHGIVTRAELRALGWSDDQVDQRVAAGLLLRRYRGVYSIGRPIETDEGQWLAAVKACGPDAALSFWSAARLWGLIETRSRLLEVTVPTTAGVRRRKLLIVHRSSTLTEEETIVRRSIPVTRVPRTIIDCAENSTERQVERLTDAAARLGWVSEGELREAAHRHPRRQGGRLLLRVLGRHQAGSTATANDFEELFLTICDAHGIPRPVVNRPLGAITPDFRWPEHRVIVETDGWATHGKQRLVFESDHERDTLLAVDGWRVLRFTWRQLTERPEWVADQVSRALRKASSRSGLRNS